MSRKARELPFIDVRGMLRVNASQPGLPPPDTHPYVNVFIDPQGHRIALAPSIAPRPGSFRWLSSERPTLYLKGALLATGLEFKNSALTYQSEGALFIIAPIEPSINGTGAWQPFHCRSSADIPMLSLDTRGTLVLDRHCLRLLNLHTDLSAEASYEENSGIFTLTFSSQGSLAVRMVGSHAEISFRGTLSSLGLPLAGKRIRYTASIAGPNLRFCVRDPFLPIRV